MIMIPEIGRGWRGCEEGLNEGERRAGNGIRQGKLKRTENWGVGSGRGVGGGDILVCS